MTEFQRDLDDLVAHHNIKTAAFTGTTEDGTYIGHICGSPSHTDYYLTALCVGRLWQFVRESIRQSLNQFDAWPRGGGK